jgi:hypothetical protein
VIHEAVSSGWESPELDFDAIADWIPAGHATDTQLSDLAYRIARELVSRLDSVRQCADRYLETNRQNVERIRRDSVGNPAPIARHPAGFFLPSVCDTLSGPRLAVTLWDTDYAFTRYTGRKPQIEKDGGTRERVRLISLRGLIALSRCGIVPRIEGGGMR